MEVCYERSFRKRAYPKTKPFTSAGLVAERALEVKKEGDYWSIYVEGKLLQDGLPSKEIAIEVALAVREVIEPYLGKEIHYFLSPRYAKYVND